jgi:hypothetical protein
LRAAHFGICNFSDIASRARQSIGYSNKADGMKIKVCLLADLRYDDFIEAQYPANRTSQKNCSSAHMNPSVLICIILVLKYSSFLFQKVKNSLKRKFQLRKLHFIVPETNF